MKTETPLLRLRKSRGMIHTDYDFNGWLREHWSLKPSGEKSYFSAPSTFHITGHTTQSQPIKWHWVCDEAFSWDRVVSITLSELSFLRSHQRIFQCAVEVKPESAGSAMNVTSNPILCFLAFWQHPQKSDMQTTCTCPSWPCPAPGTLDSSYSAFACWLGWNASMGNIPWGLLHLLEQVCISCASPCGLILGSMPVLSAFSLPADSWSPAFEISSFLVSLHPQLSPSPFVTQMRWKGLEAPCFYKFLRLCP